ncbi:MAG: hypothetical protein C0602_06315 [Denitrovibrio sp.]|mgnify:CR=1 FL=1|nr:MAG: hypothetical protein C0602_06315 [Denitrovibrio sp.]
MKKYIIGIMMLSLLALVAMPQAHAVDISKEQCRQMLALGDQAMSEEKFDVAKNYYKRALQYDPWSRAAWGKYDVLVQITSGEGTVDLSGFDFSASGDSPKQEQEEEDLDDLFGGGSSGGSVSAPTFEGC